MELNKIMTRVQHLVALAEHPDTPPAEAKLASEKADALMLQYAIDEITEEAIKPVGERSKPTMATINIGVNHDGIGYVAGMADEVARHTRCKVRHYTSTSNNEDGRREYFSTVYGFESDVAYFNVLYTTLRLHMLGALLPGVQADRSDDENAYFLHNAGYNWLDIAGMYGWKKLAWAERIRREHERGLISDEMYDKYAAGKAEIWYNERLDAYKTNWQLGSGVKRSYHREVAKRGEKPTKISAGGAKTYRLSAAQGYLTTISYRLRDAAKSRKAGSEVMLTGRLEDLEDFYREHNQNLFARCPACGKLSADPYVCDRCGAKIADAPKFNSSGRGRSSVFRARPLNQDAYTRGAAHATTADISGGARGTGSGRKSELG